MDHSPDSAVRWRRRAGPARIEINVSSTGLRALSMDDAPGRVIGGAGERADDRTLSPGRLGHGRVSGRIAIPAPSRRELGSCRGRGSPGRRRRGLSLSERRPRSPSASSCQPGGEEEPRPFNRLRGTSLRSARGWPINRAATKTVVRKRHDAGSISPDATFSMISPQPPYTTRRRTSARLRRNSLMGANRRWRARVMACVPRTRNAARIYRLADPPGDFLTRGGGGRRLRPQAQAHRREAHSPPCPFEETGAQVT